MLKKFFRFLLVSLRELFWIGVAVAIVFGGVVGFRYLGENRDVVEAQPVAVPVALVETIAFEPFAKPLPIRGEGFVAPFRQVSVSPQASGRVTFVHDAIVARGSFARDEVLIRLDDRTQQAQLLQTEANITATEVRIAQLKTDLERNKSLLARNAISATQVDALESQIAEAQANLQGLFASRETALVALADRQILAPFDGAVLSASVELGDVVSVGQALAEIFTQSELEVDVAVRQADAALVPGLFEGSQPSATIDIPFANYTFRWSGYVDRVEPRLDRATRTLTVAVRLDELLGVDGQSLDEAGLASGAPPALINTFAKVVINGASPENLYRIPSVALRGGDTLWLARDNALEMLDVTRVHVDGEWSFVELANPPVGARVITSPLAAAVPGMALRDAADRRQALLESEAAQ